jgi:hypothetical protein
MKTDELFALYDNVFASVKDSPPDPDILRLSSFLLDEPESKIIWFGTWKKII